MQGSETKEPDFCVERRRNFLKYATAGALVGAASLTPVRKAQAATISHAMWTHGTSVQVENPNQVVSVLRRGFSTLITVRENTVNNWFHFAIPTPVIVADRRLRVNAVLLVVKTSQNGISSIDNLHVYDGGNRIADFFVGIGGDIGVLKYPLPWQPEVALGIGLSVNFTPRHLRASIEFISAGVDFS